MRVESFRMNATYFGMSSSISESDWRCFKEVHSKLLERYCDEVLQEVTEAIQSAKGSAHERYQKVYRLIEERDEQLANAFNDFRRSTAVLQLAVMRRMKLLTNEELGLFSEQTRNQINGIVGLEEL